MIQLLVNPPWRILGTARLIDMKIAPIELVHAQHVRHLIEKYTTGGSHERGELESLLATGSVAARVKVLKELEKHESGLCSRLETDYRHERAGLAARAYVHPGLATLINDQRKDVASLMLARINKLQGLATPARYGRELEVPPDGFNPGPGQVVSRVARLMIEPTQVVATVNRNSVIAIPYEGQTSFEKKTEPISVEWHVGPGEHAGIAWVYTSGGKARDALRALHDFFALGVSSDPLEFNFKHLASLRMTLGLYPIAFSGKDEKGKFGTVEYGGKEVGSYREPLDETDPRFQDQWGPGKRRYDVGFRHLHPDGYIEKAEVVMHMTAHPSITFQKRPSTRTINAFVGALAGVAG